MSELNKWSAEKVGLTVYADEGRIKILTIPKDWAFDESEWTLSDARCREIVREYFKIHTNQMLSGDVICGAHPYGGEFIGKSIAEAEIACIKAIMEAENE